MSTKLFTFIDLETTGLDPNTGHILEIAVVVVDESLVPVYEKSAVIHQQSESLDILSWDQAAVNMHVKNGLLAEVTALSRDKTASTRYNNGIASLRSKLGRLHAKVEQRKFIAAGFSVHFDLNWLREHEPDFHKDFSHRVLDVSSLKMAANAWCPDRPKLPKTETAHRALADCKDAIEACRQLRNSFFTAACPNCGHTLQIGTDGFACQNCGETYAHPCNDTPAGV